MKKNINSYSDKTNNYQTVIDEFSNNKSINYNSFQSEQELEEKFISDLVNKNNYEYFSISENNEKDHEKILIQNLKKQIELLNDIEFTDNEWNCFFYKYISNKNEEFYHKTKKVQIDYIYPLERDDGTIKNIYIINKNDIFKNKLQIINQYVNNSGQYLNRYDVTILVNGLPLIHIELKRRGVQLKEAFNQINRYKLNSFSTSSCLFDYIHIFVISNGTNTKYYSNTVRYLESNKFTNNKIKSNSSKSFEFTIHWSDSKNNLITDLDNFTETFFAKHTILNLITKYCVFTSDNKLLVMRPYQIVAAEKILDRIKYSYENKNILGTVDAGGYIWHTTGSGKTLTSFKTSQLAQSLSYVYKVIFVVDRKDLDYQTMKEYNNFEKDCANSNTSTKILQKQLENESSKIIITTIQKLSIFIKKNPNHDIYNKHIVIIFDECHRSQFGDMHNAIINKFKKYNIFGFTGTPIFAKNSTINTSNFKKNINEFENEKIILKTTEQLFGDKLHAYTIIDAINDKTVLPFRFSEKSTFKLKNNIQDELVKDIEREDVWFFPKRIELITKYIIDNFNNETYRNKTYSFNKNTNLKKYDNYKNKQKMDVKGFNSIFAVQSIKMAKLYYEEFKKQLELRKDINLNIALIYSFSPNENLNDVDEFIDDENNENTNGLDINSRQFLDNAIKDYNEMFGCSYDSSPESFQNYYRDISERMKNKEIDLLIVVNMFLTGFDAPTLNTLWIDKKLKMHGLIQAFSRTNRIWNSIKTHGNIISFRPMSNELKEAIELFGDKNSSGIILLREFKDYYFGYKNNAGIFEPGYKQITHNLLINYPVGKRIVGEENKINFIKLFSRFLKIRNILLSFEEFNNDKIKIISKRQIQDYLSIYQDTYDELNKIELANKKNITDDLVFEIELIKQEDVNIEYILNLISDSFKKNHNDKEVLTNISKIIESNYELRSKKDLLEKFIQSLFNDDKYKFDEIKSLIETFNEFKELEMKKDISSLIKEFNLKEKDTINFMNDCFEIGEIKTYGSDIDKILPPISRFNREINRSVFKEKVIFKLKNYFNKYFINW